MSPLRTGHLPFACTKIMNTFPYSYNPLFQLNLKLKYESSKNLKT